MTRLSVSFGNAGRSGGGGAVTPISSSGKRSLTNVGNYRMLRELGKGNFATVYEAVHTVLKIRVAIKIIDTANVVQPYVLKNLTREAKLLAKLQHPSIVCLYETIRCRSSYYLVTELATGGDLYTHIKSQPGGHLDEETAKCYARQLVSALDHMHREGIVHRDLKMENIMLRDSRKKHIKIIDFGLSNWYSGKEPQTHCGSPEYAAPELFHEGRKYGPEVDLWSLGVILYGMMAGRLPFATLRNTRTSTEERREKLMKQIFCGLTAIQEKKITATSCDYKDLVRRLLQLQPHRRIPMRQIFRHPWINGNEKNILEAIIHSSKETSARELETISEEICNATKMDSTTVEKELRDVRCGDIKGMFNIIRHRIRGNGSTDVFGESSMLSRRSIPERFYGGRVTSHSATLTKTSHYRNRGLAIDELRSNSLSLRTAGKGPTDSAERTNKLPTVGNPLRSTRAIGDLDSLHAYFRRIQLESDEFNRKSIIGGKTLKRNGVFVETTTTKPLLRQKTRPQSLEITSKLLERTNIFSRPSSSMDRRLV